MAEKAVDWAISSRAPEMVKVQRPAERRRAKWPEVPSPSIARVKIWSSLHGNLQQPEMAGMAVTRCAECIGQQDFPRVMREAQECL